MTHSRTQSLALSGLFIAMGIVLPMVLHPLGAGSLLLPMFWPVAAAGFFLPIPFAAAVAMLTPCLSFFMTGMPPLSPPVLPVMIGELAALAVAEGWFFRKFRFGLFWSLVVGLLFSRAVLMVLSRILAPVFGVPASWISWAALIQGLPGIIILLTAVPAVVGRILHQPIFRPNPAQKKPDRGRKESP
jgi:hypothetical protein